MKVTLAKALKTKNRITSRITQVKKQMASHNAYVVDKDIPVNQIKLQVNVRDLQNELNTLTNHLVNVKAAISKGNTGSAEKIFELSEMKGLVSWYEALDCQEGKVSDPYSYRINSDSNDVKRVQISLSEKNEIVKDLILRINRKQDELDEYNATNRVDIDDSVLDL
jgi:hypothetical protein